MTTPLIWYMAEGYGLPAGIEAHILHYAVELRQHGFDTKVVVFRPLPARKHRFLEALDAQSIPIVSLDDGARWRIRLRCAVLFLPWFFYILLAKREWPDVSVFRRWITIRESVRLLERRVKAEAPAIVHVFGRLRSEAWAKLPPERTIFHEMMTGTVDRSWTDEELAEFRAFAETAARYFAPGSGVAANVKKEFGIQRNIDVIFTMAAGERERGDSTMGGLDNLSRTAPTPQSPNQQSPQSPNAPIPKSPNPPISQSFPQRIPASPNSRRFGVLCRLTEQKGIRYLLDALDQYGRRNGALTFTFAGQGDLEVTIRDFVEMNRLRGVKVMPVTSAVAALREMDVFVHPSLDDAMPVAIAEALMCGIPCIASRVGGIPDLVRDGVEGILVEPRNTEEILEAMERMAAMAPVEFEGFRARARARYEAVCTPAKVGAAVAVHYADVIRQAEGTDAEEEEMSRR